MNVLTDKKHRAQPLQIRVDDYGVIMLKLRRQENHPPNELPPGTNRAQVIKARLNRILDYLFDVS